MVGQIQRARDRARKLQTTIKALVEDPLSMPPPIARTLTQWAHELVRDLGADVEEPNVCDHCDGPTPLDKWLCSEKCTECHGASIAAGKPCVGICGKPMTRHLDGSVCLDGTQRVPENWRACCDVFADHTKTCTFDLRYEWSEQHGWMIMIDDSAGGGGVQITTCPHCGTKLESPRDTLRRGYL